MTLYLRNSKNRTIVDVEIYVKRDEGKKFVEIHSTVVIDTYSELLLEREDKQEVIDTFQSISELRGWLWESYFMGEENDPEKLQDVIEEVSAFLVDVGEKYKLNFVTD